MNMERFTIQMEVLIIFCLLVDQDKEYIPDNSVIFVDDYYYYGVKNEYTDIEICKEDNEKFDY